MCCASAACSWCWKSALLAAVKNAICGTPLGLVIDGSVARNPFRGYVSKLAVTRLLILGQRKQGDRWVKLDGTLWSHSPSVNGHLQKRLGCVQRNVFTGAHPLRSLTSAARPVLAVLRHIRSTVRCSGRTLRTTLAAAQENGGFPSGFTVHPYQK
jgi:hypothetical protein